MDTSQFTFNSSQLLRDLKASPNSELKDWLFVGIFEQSPDISSALIHQLLQIGSPALLQSIEADLLNGRYVLLGDKLALVMHEAQQYTTGEQAYLGRLICAEIAFNRAAELIEYLLNWTDIKEGGKADLVLLPYFRLYSCEIGTDLARQLLGLPPKHSLFVAAVFSQLRSEIVTHSQTVETLERSLTATKDFITKKSIFAHLCTWLQVPSLASVLYSPRLQDLMSPALLTMSSEHYSIYNRLLVNKLYCL